VRDIDLLGKRRPQSVYREALWRKGVLHYVVGAAGRVPPRGGAVSL
jgi:hypothetical protein